MTRPNRLRASGAEEGTLVWAREQTAGRGRRGRAWASPPGNLYASLILRPACPPGRAAQLGFVAALAIGDALVELIAGSSGLCLQMAERRAARRPQDRRHPARIGDWQGWRPGLSSSLASGSTSSRRQPMPSFLPRPSSARGHRCRPTRRRCSKPSPGILKRWRRQWREQGFAPVRAAWRARATASAIRSGFGLKARHLHGRFARYRSARRAAAGHPRRAPSHLGRRRVSGTLAMTPPCCSPSIREILTSSSPSMPGTSCARHGGQRPTRSGQPTNTRCG